MNLLDLPERLFTRIMPVESGCWLWTGSIDRHGYGRTRGAKGHSTGAHRVIYESLVGPIPDGLQIDHLCRVTGCVNPAHLEPVTPRVNTFRGDTPARKNAARTHCVNGHPFDEANTYRMAGSVRRYCRACNRATVARRKAERKAKSE